MLEFEVTSADSADIATPRLTAHSESGLLILGSRDFFEYRAAVHCVSHSTTCITASLQGLRHSVEHQRASAGLLHRTVTYIVVVHSCTVLTRQFSLDTSK